MADNAPASRVGLTEAAGAVLMASVGAGLLSYGIMQWRKENDKDEADRTANVPTNQIQGHGGWTYASLVLAVLLILGSFALIYWRSVGTVRSGQLNR